jgi:hypothetical protein
MHRFVPPLCFLLALAMAVAGFALWAVEPPQPSAEMHQAGASGDEQYHEALQSQLHRRQLQRKVLLACLFAGSGALIVTGFLTMKPPHERREKDS